MPLLATLIGSLVTGLVGVFSRFMGFQVALRLASYIAWVSVFTVFVTAVFVCVLSLSTGLQAMFTAGAAASKIVKGFGMGLGMFIPSTASAVIGCVGSVWIACQIYKIQKQGMHNYSK